MKMRIFALLCLLLLPLFTVFYLGVVVVLLIYIIITGYSPELTFTFTNNKDKHK